MSDTKKLKIANAQHVLSGNGQDDLVRVTAVEEKTGKVFVGVFTSDRADKDLPNYDEPSDLLGKEITEKKLLGEDTHVVDAVDGLGQFTQRPDEVDEDKPVDVQESEKRQEAEEKALKEQFSATKSTKTTK